MPPPLKNIEKPRKQPVQVRSTLTVEAILDAVIQVLIAEGKDRLTTTRVAHRAGVSVGTLYQYFPNKQSLLQATLRRKLTLVTEAIEKAALENCGKPLCTIMEGVVEGFFRAKMRDPAGSLALYAVSSDIDGISILEELGHRSSAALVKALESSPERLTVSAQHASFVIQAAMTGVSRRLLEARVAVREHAAIRHSLTVMLCGYIKAVTDPRTAVSSP